MYAKGDQLPVVTDVNLINPIGSLGDGRPIFATAVNATTRRDPRFNHINQVQSIGDSTFKSMTLQDFNNGHISAVIVEGSHEGSPTDSDGR